MTGKALRRGGEEIMKDVRNHINKAALESCTDLTGFVSRSELDNINQRADLFLVCRSGSQFANFGLPWKLGEYAMTAKPILATDVSDISHYFTNQENIFLVDADDHDGISEGIINIFNNYELAEEVGRKGREKAMSEFDYLRFGREISNFAVSVISSKGRSDENSLRS